ncbi:MAG: TlpA family protein disulfide reductase [Cyclobacteriaceae bacterium]
MKSISKSRLLDIAFIIFIIVLILVPSVRVPVVSTLQRGLLFTGIFNADSETVEDTESFSYKLRVQDTTGAYINIADLRGQVLFINIWATWCPPCMAEMPEIAKLYNELGNEVAFLMLSVDKDRMKAKEWVAKQQYPVPVYFLEQLSPELAYEAIPTTWIIDQEGKIVFRHSGMAQYNTSDFRDFLRSL